MFPGSLTGRFNIRRRVTCAAHNVDIITIATFAHAVVTVRREESRTSSWPSLATSPPPMHLGTGGSTFYCAAGCAGATATTARSGAPTLPRRPAAADVEEVMSRQGQMATRPLGRLWWRVGRPSPAPRPWAAGRTPSSRAVARTREPGQVPVSRSPRASPAANRCTHTMWRAPRLSPFRGRRALPPWVTTKPRSSAAPPEPRGRLHPAMSSNGARHSSPQPTTGSERRPAGPASSAWPP